MIAPARFPFGRYRNQPLSAAPTSYISWALTIAKTTKLKDALAAELRGRRGTVDPAPHATPRPQGDRPLSLRPFDPSRERVNF